MRIYAKLRQYQDRLPILFVRIITIGIRFLFNLLIIKNFSLEEYGSYSIFYTTVTLSVIFVGLDYYYYNTREILSSDKNLQSTLIGDQIILHLATYLIFIPVSYFTLVYFIDRQFIVIFYLIFLTEHLCQEGYRLLVAYSLPLLANVTQFIRMALWCLIFLAIANVQQSLIDISLDLIYYLWFTGAVISLIITGILLNRIGVLKLKFQAGVHRRIISGLKVSMLFFISTVLFKIIEFASRYVLEVFAQKSDVGIFTFFSSLANLIYVTTYSVTIVIYYPKLIKAFNLADKTEFHTLRKKFLHEILLVSAAIAVFLLLFTPALLDIVDKAELKEHYHIFIILIIGTVFFMLSHYPQNILFLQRRDRQILISSIFAAAISLILNISLTIHFGILGAAISTSAGFIALYIIKQFFYRRRPA